MKLYAITRGAYSEYRIITLIASKEKFGVTNYDYDELARIEEYEDSEITDTRKAFRVDFGETEICVDNFTKDLLRKSDYLDDEFQEGRIERGYLDSYAVDVLANDREHAIKIAADRLAEYKYQKMIEEQGEENE